MRAVQVAAFGDPDVLTVAELPDPSPAPGLVLIDVSYSAVGLVDVIVRRGGIPFPLPFIPGLSVAGRVRAVGANVSGFEVGAPVAAFTAPPTFGGYASVVAVPAALVAQLDTSAGRVSMEAGAALIVNGPTALLALTNLSAAWIEIGHPPLQGRKSMGVQCVCAATDDQLFGCLLKG
jgi:NADPH:quinone reductase